MRRQDPDANFFLYLSSVFRCPWLGRARGKPRPSHKPTFLIPRKHGRIISALVCGLAWRGFGRRRQAGHILRPCTQACRQLAAWHAEQAALRMEKVSADQPGTSCKVSQPAGIGKAREGETRAKHHSINTRE